MNKYFVSHDGLNLGPFDVDTIHRKLASSELKASDFVYVEDKDDWVSIDQVPELIQKSSTLKNGNNNTIERPPVPTPVPSSAAEAGPSQWYVLKGKNRFGPFTFADVVKMLQEKSIFEFDYIWRESMENWKRIAETPEYSYETIRVYFEKVNTKMATQVFHRRRHKRFVHECPVIAHDNVQVWRGKTVELSEGGAGVVMENATLLPGQNVYIHFKPGENSKPFNVLCEIVSKRFVKGIKERSTPIVYGLKFINIHKLDRDEIKTIQVAV